MPGKISKIKTEPYAYTIREKGEVITLEHRYIYHPEDVESEEEKLAKQLEEAFVKSKKLKFVHKFKTYI